MSNFRLPGFRPSLAFWFATATLISAFLVFQVQPVISKAVLPWFGGSPAVWTTCLLFFQVALFGGYAYAHWLTSRFAPRRQGLIHVTLLAAALCLLPIIPGAHWKPDGSENPMLRILTILTATVGLPYFLLSATGPLLQCWFSRSCSGQSPYRMYALSNIGSLAALLSYPFLVEPSFTISNQGAYWSLGFCAFATVCGGIVWGMRKSVEQVEIVPTQKPTESLGWNRPLAWLLLPAFASAMLLATTNHVCQDVAVIPFLWIAPLALYLLTFIISFDRERWYVRRRFATLTLVSIVVLHVALFLNKTLPLVPEVLLYLGCMFLVCMLCHGELVRCKPQPQFLTKFYLLTSAGGALGGVIVAVLCPLIFATYYELQLAMLLGTVLACGLLFADLRVSFFTSPQRKFMGALVCLAVVLSIVKIQRQLEDQHALHCNRNFYGTLHVTRSSAKASLGNSLVHGRIVHGFQFDGDARRQPTTYFSERSGVGIALRHFHADSPQRVGIVGLGCGTLAAYGRANDYFRFYEINPAVIDVAQQVFSFLRDCEAKVDIQLGDARLAMERESPQEFDILVLDAFSGDSIPAHLLTQEAFSVYRRHLKPRGLIAVHISNRHLDLEPVIRRQASALGIDCVRIDGPANFDQAVLASKWMLLTENESFLSRPSVAQVTKKLGPVADASFPLWTDQYNNLFQILKVF